MCKYVFSIACIDQSVTQQQMDQQAPIYIGNVGGDLHIGDLYYKCIVSNKISPSDELLLKQKTWLQHRYKKGNMPSLLWNDSSNDLPLEKYFVPLRVDEDHLMKRFATGCKIQLNEVFFTKDVIGKRRKTRILIRGNPGFGKTTVIRKLAYDWATLLEDRDKPHYMQMFDIVVIISLINLGDHTIQEAVIHELSGKHEISLEALQQTQLKFLLLLDGYDEAFNKDKVLQFLQVEAEDGFFVNYTILVTSRPQAANDISWGEFDRHLSILGFSKENKITYIKEILCDQNERMMKMLQKIENNQFYLELSTCPLMLHMFCCLESEGNCRSLNTLTGLYTELIRLLIRRYIKKHKNLDVSLFEHGDHFLRENLIQKLGCLARRFFKISNSSITTLSEATLRKEFCNDFEFITGLGILTPIQITTNGGDNCSNYDFIHRTIAEFLVVFYIAKMSEIQSPFELYNLYLKNNIHVICFFFGLLGEKVLKCNSILQYFRDTVWEVDWIGGFKDEISATTWDTLALRKFIRKLSGYTHNFTKSAIWYPLHRHIEEIKAYVNPDEDNWDASRAIVIETIQSCELLTTLKIFFQHCSKFQFNCDKSGKALLLDIRFLMDDLIKLSLSESLKTFDIEFRNFNISDSCRSELSVQDCAQHQLSVIENKVFGLKSLQVLNGTDSLCTVFWNVGKLNFTLTFENNTQNIRCVVLLVSEEQFNTIVQPPFSFPGKEERQYAVVIEKGTISHMKNPFVTW